METKLIVEDPTTRSDRRVVVAENVTKTFGAGDSAVHAVRGISLEVAGGHLVAVMGPSGSGKSTLMHLLAGLDTVTTGEIRIDETQITGLSEEALTQVRRRHIGFVFQFFNLLPILTAEENIRLPLEIGGQAPDEAWVEELVRTVGIADRLRHRPSELSGGQQQRVAIARALVGRPTVVFADEPTGNLDSRASGEILDLLRHGVDEYGQTTVMVTHDPGAATIADEIFFLADGRIVQRLGRATRREVVAAMEEVTRR